MGILNSPFFINFLAFVDEIANRPFLGNQHVQSCELLFIRDLVKCLENTLWDTGRFPTSLQGTSVPHGKDSFQFIPNCLR